MSTKSSKVSSCYIFLIIEGMNAKTELDFFTALAKEYNHYLNDVMGIKILEPLAINPFGRQKKDWSMATKLKLSNLQKMCKQHENAKVILVCDNDYQIEIPQLRINWEMTKKFLKEKNLVNEVYYGLYPEGKTIEYLLSLTYPKEFLSNGLIGEGKPFKSLEEVKRPSALGNLKKIQFHFQERKNYNQFNPVEELFKNIKPLKLTPPILIPEWQICWSQIFKMKESNDKN